MGKKAAKDLNVSYNAVALEDAITSASLEITVETPEVTGLSDAGPRRVEGNYDFQAGLEGAADFASGGQDATLFGRIGNGGAAFAFDPTGAGAPGVNDPHYDASSMIVSAYSLKGAVGTGVTYSATLVGNSALTRATA